MFMARSRERLAADAYTRDSVEAYLRAAADQRTKVELAIAEAERRREVAIGILEVLEGLRRPTHGPGESGARGEDPGD